MLSKKTKYAINALCVLTRNKESLTIGSIAEKGRIPKKFLELILINLRNSGYVTSTRGKFGGYTLSKKASEINITEILRLFNGPIALAPCATHKYYKPCEECKNEENCGLRHHLKKLRDLEVEYLKGVSIQNIVDYEDTHDGVLIDVSVNKN